MQPRLWVPHPEEVGGERRRAGVLVFLGLFFGGVTMMMGVGVISRVKILRSCGQHLTAPLFQHSWSFELAEMVVRTTVVALGKRAGPCCKRTGPCYKRTRWCTPCGTAAARAGPYDRFAKETLVMVADYIVFGSAR